MVSKVQKIIDDINETIEHKSNSSGYKRYYLGASSIGNECSRQLWYGFRHCSQEYVDSKSQKRFDDGFHSEDVYIKRLKDAGYQLQHEEDGKQYGFKDLGGWFRGHRDGKLFNLPEIGNAIWEHKSSAKWKALDKAIEKHGEENALKEWNETYYYQGQLYMGYDKTNWHVLTCASEGSREETIVLTQFNENDFNRTREKARNIICSDSPPPKISDNPTFFKCGWCHAKEVCHSFALPKPNCRNCAYVTFDADNPDNENPRAHCGKFDNYIPNPKAMQEFYACHRFNPCFFEEDCFGLQGDDIVYRTMEGKDFKNGDEGFNSMQMYENQETKPWLSWVGDAASKFGVSFVEENKL